MPPLHLLLRRLGALPLQSSHLEVAGSDQLGVSMVIGDRRCLVPLTQATPQELLATTSIFTQVEIIIRPKARQQ